MVHIQSALYVFMLSNAVHHCRFILQVCLYSVVSETPTIQLYPTWKEDYCRAKMITNVDLDWRVLLDSDWELFGGEIKFNGVDCHIDGVPTNADSSEAVDWQAVDDDVLSLCSSASSWSCLHGNSLLETCNFCSAA